MNDLGNQLTQGKIYRIERFNGDEIIDMIPFIEKDEQILRFAEIGEFVHDVFDIKDPNAETHGATIKTNEGGHHYSVDNKPESAIYDPEKYSRITKILQAMN